MNVLSLFNGMSFGMMALETLDIKVDKYYSSEIDKYANQATKVLFPDVIQLGDVTKWREWNIDLSSINLLLAGFPCQAWSIAGKQKGDDDPRGALVHDLINIWHQINRSRKVLGKKPVKFMFENVKMKKEFLDYINNLFGVDPILINSALVSAQNRVRYYWTNIEGVEQPEDRGIVLSDILEDMSTKCGRMVGRKINPETGKRDDYNPELTAVQRFEIRPDHKSGCLTTVEKDNLIVLSVNDNDRVKLITENERGYRPHKNDVSKSGISELGRILKVGAGKTDTVTTSHAPKLAVNSDINNLQYRKLTPRECFRLQTVPERHIDTLLNSGISNTQLYKMCGNGWTHDVITHILKNVTKKEPRMAKQIAWSWTRLDTFELCPRKFQGSYITKEFPKTDFSAPHFVKGKAVHKALEDYLKDGVVPPYPIEYKGEQFFVKLDFLLPLMDKMHKGEKHIETRICFNDELDEVGWWDKRAWCRVIFDALIIVDDFALCIDWKTGKVKQYSDQLKLFAGAVFAKFPKVERVLTAYVWCEHPNQSPTYKEFPRSEMVPIWQEFGDRAELIQMANESGNWPAKKNMFCNWCDALPSQCEFKQSD